MTHFLAEFMPPVEFSWSAWPTNNTFVVRAMNGRECVTAAASSDPWWAAWKCAGFMLNRMKSLKTAA